MALLGLEAGRTFTALYFIFHLLVSASTLVWVLSEDSEFGFESAGSVTAPVCLARS